MAGPSSIFAKLPIELKAHTIGFAVANDEPIDVTCFDQRLDALTFPFSADGDLLAIAEREALQSNSFLLDGDDTIAEWLPADLAQIPSRWSEQEQGQSGLQAEIEASANLAVGLNFTPRLFSISNGQITADIRHIRHLRIKFSIIATGGDMDDDEGSFKVGRATARLLRSIPAVFPRLESLDIFLNSTGETRPGATYTTEGLQVPASEMPLGRALERFRTVDDFVEIVDSLKMGRTRRLCKKTLTLNQKAIPQEYRDDLMPNAQTPGGKAVKAQLWLTRDILAIDLN